MQCEYCGHKIQNMDQAIQRGGHTFDSQGCADSWQRDQGEQATAR